MKKSIPFLITLSLLIGLLITVGTSRVSKPGQDLLVQNCGYSISSQTNQHTTLKYCLEYSYGWPIKYAASNVNAILRDYHTLLPALPSNASSFIGTTSFSRLKILEDWVIWSVISAIVVTIVAKLVPDKSKKRK